MTSKVLPTVKLKNIKPKVIKPKNKGTGAGGSNTNATGLSFEKKTSIEKKLNDENWKKEILNKNINGYCYNHTEEFTDETTGEKCEIKYTYVKQSGLKAYMKKNFGITIDKKPDEAFIIQCKDKYHIKILEKKNQNTDGSVEDKLKTGKFTRTEYDKILKKQSSTKNFDISYAFCISTFLANKFCSNKIKYNIIKEIMDEDDIKIFYGDESNYFDILFEWIKTI